MKAEASGGGRIRLGGWVTVLVDLSNQGGEVATELVITHLDGPEWERSPEYVVPVALPAGGKKRVPVSVPSYSGGRIRVTLRSGGTTLQLQDLQLINLSPDQLLVGVLSDDELGIPALARLGGTAGAGQVARLSAATLPASAALLETYDALAISRFDTSSMTTEQMKALEAWVGRGGMLLVAGGPEYKRTFAQLPASLLPVAATGVREVDLATLGDLAGTPMTGKAQVTDGKAVRGQVLAAAGETPLVVVDRVGLGKVIYLAVDPSLEPLASWAGLPDLLERLLVRPDRSDFMDQNNTDQMMMSALQQLPGLGLPSSLLMGSILGGYLLLVGPISYWILKRKDRREWLWVTVPALSVAFVGAVYAAGFGKQINMISHLITVTELSPGAQAATMTSYVGVYAPSKSRLDVELGAGQMVRPLTGYYGQNNDRSTRVIYGEQTTVQLLDLNNYSMKGFSLEQDVALPGGLEVADVTIDEAGNLTGKVINRLDRPVLDVQISAGGAWEQIGTLQPGQTSEPFTLDLARTNPKFNGMPVFFSAGPVSNADQQRRQQVLAALLGWQGEQVGGGAITIVGWTEQPLANPAVPELGHLNQGTNMLLARAPIPVDTARGELPPGVVIGVHSSGPGYGRSPYGYSLAGGSHTFSMILPPIDPAKVAEVKLHTGVLGGGSYTLAIKNQKTGEWVTMNNSSIQVLEGWQNYVGSGGLIEIKVDVTQNLEMSAPTVSVKGVAR